MTGIRVLVVDDSVVVRHLLTDALAADPDIDVVGVAADGRVALAKVAQLAPDLVTMDLEMPQMDGIAAVRELRRTGYRRPVIMFSTLTERGAAATLDALAAGATDYVTKPSAPASMQAAIAQVVADLVPRIKALVPGHRSAPGGPDRSAAAPSGAGPSALKARTDGGGPRVARPLPPRASGPVPPSAVRPVPPRPVRAVVLGTSTGGPEALSRVLSALTAPLPVPMLVVQHMPALFTRQLAARLDRLGPCTVVEAEADQELRAGVVLIAPGDRHLQVGRGGSRAVVTCGPPVNFCRPSVDVLFRSAVRAFGPDLLAVVLTGMGADGRDGCAEVVAAGGTVVAQDQESSVVWGMPGAVVAAGLAHHVVPLGDVAGTIEAVLGRVAAPTAAASREGLR